MSSRRFTSSVLCTVVSMTIATSLHAQALYQETYRPQFHFTAEKDWLNDPNGMVFHEGEYHLFFQRTPNSLEGQKKTWGHAASTDMLHWKQLADAIKPDELGDIWSGSAIIDWNNTAGFQTGDEKEMVAIYTAAGNPFTQCIAYSNDRGRTWTKYAGNPVLPHINGGNRDPKMVWFEQGQEWVMALYLDHKNDYALFTSPDMKKWTRIQTVTVPDAAECPDFFPMNLDGDPAKTRWVFTGANGRYLVGTFDGKVFASDGTSHIVEYGNSYAVQTFSDIPAADGRRIQIGWMRDGQYPKMPFNQQMSIPCELTLHSTPDGPRLGKYPVKEINLLHDALHEWKDVTLQPDTDLLNGLSGDLFDITAEIEPSAKAKTIFSIRGTAVQFDAANQSLSCEKSKAPLKLESNRIKLRILVDRTSIESFGNNGAVAVSNCFLPKDEDRSLSLKCSGGTIRVVSLRIYSMKSAWENR